MQSTEVEATRNWLEKMVIGENLCPFAHKEWARGSIRYEVLTNTDDGQVYDHFIEELETLRANESISTTLIIWPQVDNFNDFLDKVAMLETALQLNGLESVFQLAHFHPRYVFDGNSEDAPDNYTNRSPYPILHILRSEQIEKVLRKYPEPESIPDNNINRMHEIGLEQLKKILEATKPS